MSEKANVCEWIYRHGAVSSCQEVVAFVPDEEDAKRIGALAGLAAPSEAIEAAKEALRFYADGSIYVAAAIADTGDSEEPVLSDGGSVARRALALLSEGGA